jgi:hypothetical protein
MTALAKTTTIVNDRPILSSEKDYNRKCSVGKEILVVGLKGPVAKTN